MLCKADATMEFYSAFDIEQGHFSSPFIKYKRQRIAYKDDF